MTSGIKTQHIHADGSLSPVFEYITNYHWGKIEGPLISYKVMDEPGVWITYPDGVRIFRPNSYYEHIEPLKPSDKDIF